VPYLKLCGLVLGGWLMAKSAAVAEARLAAGHDREFLSAKIQTARFYAEQVLPNALAFARIVRSGAASVLEADTAAAAAG
jgi:butyryl-CoA dehydrogenase